MNPLEVTGTSASRAYWERKLYDTDPYRRISCPYCSLTVCAKGFRDHLRSSARCEAARIEKGVQQTGKDRSIQILAITPSRGQTRRYLAVHTPEGGPPNVGIFRVTCGNVAADAACDAWGVDRKHWPEIHVKALDSLEDGWSLFLTDEGRE